MTSLGAAPSAEYSENLAKQREAILARSAQAGHWPDMMLVVLTGRCNIECIQCPYRNSLLQDVPDHVVDQIPLFFPYLRIVEWEGGEAFVHRRFYELVSKAASHPSLRQVITTNGLLFNRDWQELIARSAVSLAISVDGAKPESYEAIRVGGRWDHLIRNIEALNDAFDRSGRSPRHQLNVVLMRRNVGELDEFVEFAARYRFATVNFKMMKEFSHIPEVHGENLYAPQNASLLKRLIVSVPAIDQACRERGMTASWPGLSRPEEVAAGEPALSNAVTENRMRVEEHRIGGRLQERGASTVGSGRPETLHCVLPWRRLYVHTGGVSVACGCIPEERYTPDFDLVAFWNSRMMRAFRERIARGATDWCGMNCLLGRENRMSERQWQQWRGGIPVCGEIVSP